jgi:CRISPR type I-E-associated protein CasB/Cse2
MVSPERDPARTQFVRARRFRRRFDAILQAPLPALEPHLRWALSAIADGVERGTVSGMDWVQLLHDLSIWDRGEEHRRERDVRDIWAKDYLDAVDRVGEASSAEHSSSIQWR